MNYENYLNASSDPYVNAMPGGQSGAQPAAQVKVAPPMSMAEWAAYFKSLSPEDQALFANQFKGPDFGSGNPLESLMGMFGGKGKTGEGG